MKRRAGLALLFLAWLLPLQGFAFAASCNVADPAQTAQHCSTGHPDLPSTGAHHGCGACCCIALSTAPVGVMTGRVPSAAVSSTPPQAAHPILFRDRLDRPPRD